MGTYEVTEFALVFDLDGWFSALLMNSERPVLDVALDVRVVHLATNKSLGVENGVRRVGVESVLGGVTDQSFFVGEGDP